LVCLNLEIYIRQFAHLRRAPNVVFTAASKRQAPHKPILLLAGLDLVARGVITSPFIAVTGDLTELNELFNLYWRRIIPWSDQQYRLSLLSVSAGHEGMQVESVSLPGAG
jgi:hypothetical protein